LSEFVEFGRQSVAPSRRPRRWRLWGLAALAAGSLGVAVLAERQGQAPVEAVASRLSPADFIVNERLAPLISFSSPETVRTQIQYQARARDGGEERWDTLTFGDADADEVVFRVTVRAAKSARARASFFVELAKQSAEIGAAVVHAANPVSYTTERGAIEWGDITLSGSKGERVCLGFRFARAESIDLSGLACGSHGAPLDRAALGCLIDRLSPTSSGMEAGLGEIFKSDAPRRTACPRVVG
jgi:hypothetical protein